MSQDHPRTPTVHELKCRPPYFEEVLSGRKPFEIRLNDRMFRIGDILWLREWAADWRGLNDSYTGRECRREITYITDYEQRANFVVLGLKASDCSAPRGTYIPLTRHQVEEWREELLRFHEYLESGAEVTGELNRLCDMAVNSLLYAEEIQRVRELAPSDAIAALRELVACKDMHDRIENRGNSISTDEARELGREYRQRRPAAWERAREVLAAIDPIANKKEPA